MSESWHYTVAFTIPFRTAAPSDLRASPKQCVDSGGKQRLAGLQ